MNLTEALAQSQPLPPTQQMARLTHSNGPISVAFDGNLWDVLWQGSPFGFTTRAEQRGAPQRGERSASLARSISCLVAH